MRIIEITDSGTTDFPGLIDLLHQQMIDIGSEKRRSAIESAVQTSDFGKIAVAGHCYCVPYPRGETNWTNY